MLDKSKNTPKDGTSNGKNKQKAKDQPTKPRNRDRLNDNRFGSVVSRKGRLSFDLYYLRRRVRVAIGLEDTAENRLLARAELDIIGADIRLGKFKFYERFPDHPRAAEFARIEGATIKRKPSELIYGDYFDSLFPQIKDNYAPLNAKLFKGYMKRYVIPILGYLSFEDLSRTKAEKWVAGLKKETTKRGNIIHPKTTRDVVTFARKIFNSAIDEFGWEPKMKEIFDKLPLDDIPEYNIKPFEREEWGRLSPHIDPFYLPYYLFAITRGMRPQEIIALLWSAVKGGYIHVKRTRTAGIESDKMKTKLSKRRIEITPKIQAILDMQKKLAERIGYNGPYVFFNEWKRPISPKNLMRKVWRPALEASGVAPRRQYDCRHTFASWALSAGESLIWVSRTMGHSTPMTTLDRYVEFIKNPAGPDGSFMDAAIPNSDFEWLA